nr:macrolide family glycosyltransferase [uncultured Ruminococcus sp.]
MKRIAFFCIPAHGHTNPMLPVAAELVKRGDSVRFYSFDEFRDKIEKTGAAFISCTSFLPEVNEEQMARLMNVSQTEMTLQAIRTTLSMNDFLEEEFKRFSPDVIYTDSVCFWGKLNAWKHHVPMVCSTSTFAFNQLSSKYMKQSRAEVRDMILGLPKISKELKTLRPYGYEVKSALALVANNNQTDTVVYTSRRFQPFAESFTSHYRFVGPSVFSDLTPQKDKARPLIYISLGTVINDRPDFYRKCITALRDMDADVIISRGQYMDEKKLGDLPDNIQAFERVDQLEVLSRADVFITHCGMNSVSESLYMATPMALYPQTAEQHAVARRTQEVGAGVMLDDDSIEGIRRTVKTLLSDQQYAKAAGECCEDFRSCSGAKGAAEFIENAPHTCDGIDPIAEMNKVNRLWSIIFPILATLIGILLGTQISWGLGITVGLALGVLSYPLNTCVQKLRYNAVIRKMKTQ